MKIRKLFKPSEEYMNTLPMRDRQQIGYVIDGSFILMASFLLLTTALFAIKLPLSASLCIIPTLLFFISLFLVKKDKLYTAAKLVTVGLIFAIFIILFFTGDYPSTLIFYRNASFIVTMAICNQLISLNKRQIKLFFAGTSILWLINCCILFKSHYESNFSGTVSGIIICSLAIYVANTIILILNNFNQRLVENATKSQEEASNHLNSITKIIEESKSGLEIGNHLYSATQTATNNISELTTLFQTVSDNSSNLSKETSTISKSSLEVKSQSEQMLQTVTLQNTAIDSTNKAMNEMSESLSEMSSIAQKHKAEMSLIANNLDSQLNLINKLVRQVEEVQTSSNNIANFVSTVNAISAKTGLLAMNASIEAAHAGEAGKGFSVIAQEIRQLSNSTTLNASKISDGLQENSKIVEETAASVADFHKFTQKTTEELRKTISAIEAILASILSVNEETKTIMDSLNDVVKQSHETGYIAGIVVSEIENQNSALENIATIATSLQSSVEGMDSQVSEIKDVIHGIENEAMTNVEVSKKITGAMNK